MSYNLNNSFPLFPFPTADKNDSLDFIDDKNNSFVFNFNFMIDQNENNSIEQNNLVINDNNLNFSQFQSSKKKNSIQDMSYSIDQTESKFLENSHMIIEEEFPGGNNPEENYLKIEGEDPGQGIDRIEENYFEAGGNESFLHENAFFFHNMPDNTTSFDNGNSSAPSEFMKFDNTLDDIELLRMKKNFMNLKLSKSSFGNVNNLSNFKLNKSVNNGTHMNTNINSNSNNLDNICTNNLYGGNSNNKKIFNVFNSSSIELMNNNSNSFKLNLSNLNNSHKKGRKKVLLNGIKTEIIDKAYIREFKKYLKCKKNQLKNFFEEDVIFWSEFFQNTIPPLMFTNSNGDKIEYKSYNRALLKFIFSKHSCCILYSKFIQEKEKDLFSNIISKKSKKIDYKMLLFYKFYGKNLHKFYSEDYSINDINYDELENTFVDSSNLSFNNYN